MLMRPIERPKSLTATVLHRLRQSIVEGDLALGQPLSERQLAENFGISKTPVREALAQLRHEGLVRILPQRGAFVFTLSAREITHICELRLTLETAALRLAFERDRNGLTRALESTVAEMKRARASQNLRGYLNADTRFHEVFFKNCGNPLLAETYSIYVGKIAALRTHLAVKPLHTERSFEEHCQILRCIGKHDLTEAMQILDRHIERTKTTYAETVEDIAAADQSTLVAS
jgi:DNA-binding GntR family transcriptional regulator